MEKVQIKDEIKAHEVKDTPFTIVEHTDEKGTTCHIAVGNQFVSNQQFETVEQAKKYIAKKPYELIFATCIVIFNKLNERNQTIKEDKQ